ncbi:hypothetical protein J0H58_28365 [bacterium]|nr:hypothetical protein [bacterium]
MATATIDSEAAAAADVVKRLVATGQAELDAIERAAAEAKARKTAEDRAKRAVVLREIKAAIVANGQVPAELFPFMRPNGLEDDGRHNGYVTITVGLPGYGEGVYVSFNVNQSATPGQWYVKAEWIARRGRGGTIGYPTFAQAVAAEVAEATNEIPL